MSRCFRDGAVGASPGAVMVKAPLSRGPEMGRRPPPLSGTKCASARREFRWNHGHRNMFALSPKGSGRLFCPESQLMTEKER